MSSSEHPDPTIAAWLDDGPSSLSAALRSAVKSTARSTPQRRVVRVALPDRRSLRLLAITAALLVVALPLALVAGGARLFSVPQPTVNPQPTLHLQPTLAPSLEPTPGVATPAPSNQPGPGAAVIRRPWLTLSFTYRIPEGQVLAFSGAGQEQVESRRVGYVWFTEGAPWAYGTPPVPLSYPADQSPPPDPTFVVGSRGVIVEEVTNAIAHFTNYAALGSDAASFLAGMAANEQFRVGTVSATTLDGVPALTALVTQGHFDIHHGPGVTTSVNFALPSRVIVADIDGAIVMVQIWAGSEQELDAWLPRAMEFVSTMRFEVTHH